MIHLSIKRIPQGLFIAPQNESVTSVLSQEAAFARKVCGHNKKALSNTKITNGEFDVTIYLIGGVIKSLTKRSSRKYKLKGFYLLTSGPT